MPVSLHLLQFVEVVSLIGELIEHELVSIDLHICLLEQPGRRTESSFIRGEDLSVGRDESKAVRLAMRLLLFLLLLIFPRLISLLLLILLLVKGFARVRWVVLVNLHQSSSLFASYNLIAVEIIFLTLVKVSFRV